MKILICDDHPVVINGLAEHLENYPLLEICDTASNGFQAIEKYFLEKPDVIIMDISMPEMNGLEAAKRILTKDKEAKILFYSMNLDQSEIYASYKIGGMGFVSKENSLDEVITALHTVRDNEKYFGELFSLKNLLEFENRNQRTKRKLSFREKDILHYVAKDFTDVEIAEVLGIELRMVKNSKLSIKQKFSLSSVDEVKDYALKYSEEQKNSDS